MGLVWPQATDCKAGFPIFHPCCDSLVFLGPPQELWPNCYCRIGGERPVVEWHDVAWHWDSSQYLAFRPKEIPTLKDFSTKIGEYFKMEINQIVKADTFSHEKEDPKLIGESIRN